LAKGYVNIIPKKNRINPEYLKKNAIKTPTKISIKNNLIALKLMLIDSKMLLFMKNIIGAENMVIKIQTNGKTIVNPSKEDVIIQKR
jgi:hypothetical protein